jgi:hypothetical protein
MKKQLFIFMLVAISMSSAAFAEKPEGKLICVGAHSETGAPVYGECIDGEFTGYFSQTGKPVYGKCDVNGRLRAYDPETGKQVLGKCKKPNER